MSLPDSHPAHPLLFMGAGGSHPRIPRLPGDGVGASRTQLRRQVRRWLQVGIYVLDILIRKISQDPIGLHGQGAIENYIPKFQVFTMSLEVA